MIKCPTCGSYNSEFEKPALFPCYWCRWILIRWWLAEHPRQRHK
jgi:endogenous inhibitor of DNA gyrase (YacG/DUF329 family)